MTIQVELSHETETRLAEQAAARHMDVPTYVATLLEQAANPADRNSGFVGRKSLVQLFAESPFRDLDLDFKRDSDPGREIDL